MPRNTNVVMIIVSETWENSVETDGSSPAQKLSRNSPASNDNATATMNTRIGTILATVTMRLIVAASFTPRAIR